MKKYRKVQTLSMGISKFLSESVPENFYFLALLRKSWNKIIGEGLAKHSQPFSIRNRVLVINVDDPIWLQELNLNKDEIKNEILKFFNDKKYENLFNSIHFRIGEISSVQEKEKQFAKQIDPETLKIIEETIKNVEEQELKDALKHYLIESCSKITIKNK